MIIINEVSQNFLGWWFSNQAVGVGWWLVNLIGPIVKWSGDPISQANPNPKLFQEWQATSSSRNWTNTDRIQASAKNQERERVCVGWVSSKERNNGVQQRGVIISGQHISRRVAVPSLLSRAFKQPPVVRSALLFPSPTLWAFCYLSLDLLLPPSFAFSLLPLLLLRLRLRFIYPLLRWQRRLLRSTFGLILPPDRPKWSLYSNSHSNSCLGFPFWNYVNEVHDLSIVHVTC